jgi:hypothetical protein
MAKKMKGKNKKPTATVRADAVGLDRTGEQSPLVRAVIGGTHNHESIWEMRGVIMDDL